MRTIPSFDNSSLFSLWSVSASRSCRTSSHKNRFCCDALCASTNESGEFSHKAWFPATPPDGVALCASRMASDKHAMRFQLAVTLALYQACYLCTVPGMLSAVYFNVYYSKTCNILRRLYIASLEMITRACSLWIKLTFSPRGMLWLLWAGDRMCPSRRISACFLLWLVVLPCWLMKALVVPISIVHGICYFCPGGVLWFVLGLVLFQFSLLVADAKSAIWKKGTILEQGKFVCNRSNCCRI